MKVSVVVTAHNEGELIESTLESVFRALEGVTFSYEIIIHIDEGTAETYEAVEQYRARKEVTVVENHFKDVGPARNYAAQIAKGEYIFFVDGDDLVSKNFFVEMLKVLEERGERVVVSPEYELEFDAGRKRCAVLKMEDSKTREWNAYMLFNVNLWVVAIAGRREIFLEHPYKPTVGGYGHEDYTLNIDLASAGIAHLVAPGAIYFYRDKMQSRRTWNEEKRSAQPYTELFSAEFWKDSVDKAIGKGLEPTGARRTYLVVRNIPVIGRGAELAMRLAKGILGGRVAKANLPALVVAEWDEIAKIDARASRKDKKLRGFGALGVNPHCPASQAYLEICRENPEFREIDFKKRAKRLNDKQKDLLMSRIMVQSRGRASFTDEGYLRIWKQRHQELVNSLGKQKDGAC